LGFLKKESTKESRRGERDSQEMKGSHPYLEKKKRKKKKVKIYLAVGGESAVGD